MMCVQQTAIRKRLGPLTGWLLLLAPLDAIAQDAAKAQPAQQERVTVTVQVQAQAADAVEQKAVKRIDPRVKRAAAQAAVAAVARNVAVQQKKLVDEKAPELARDLFGAAAAQAVAGVAVLAIGDANDNLEQQFKPQFEPLMKAELYYARSLCKPDGPQYLALKQAADRALTNAISQYAAAQRQAQRGGLRIVNGQPSMVFPNPQQVIADGLLAAVRANMPEASVAIYAAESEKRRAQRKQAAIRIMVAKMDREVILSPEQRAQINESLTQHYDEQWGTALERFSYGDDYVPRPPDARVVQFLNANQKAAWAASSNPNQGIFWGWAGNALGQGAMLDPDALTE